MTTLQELIESEIGDFFAGFGQPDAPVTPEEMQKQLMERVTPLLTHKTGTGTITRGRVAEIIIAAGLEYCDYGAVFNSIKTGEIVAMARIAQASLEAEPVMYVMVGKGFDSDAISVSKAVVDGWVDEWNEMGEESFRTVPLYTAPPVPEPFKRMADKND